MSPLESTMATVPTHHEVLGVSVDATYEEIKSSFHRLARIHHPDKQSYRLPSSGTVVQENPNTCDEQAESFEFRNIQQAWEVLREDKSRKEYEMRLQQTSLQAQSKVAGAVSLMWDDLEEAQDDDTGETIWVYDCRCGEEVIFDDIHEDGSDPVTCECPGCCFVYQFPLPRKQEK